MRFHLLARASILVSLAAIALLAEPASTPPITLPPEPVEPDVSKLSPADAAQARQAYYIQHRSWHKSLTSEQQHYYRTQVLALPPEGKSIPDATDGYRWETAAARTGCTPAEIEHLRTHKLLQREKSFDQIFEPYLNTNRPFFITTDSLLNAFHVLFEDSFRTLELRRAERLRPALETILTRTRAWQKEQPYPAADLAPGWLHAQRVIGPALHLLGTPLDFFDTEIRADIADTVALIRAADQITLPVWLGKPTRDFLAIDFNRCRPVGFYADDPTLADYFRALRWLQLVPLRVDHPQELSTMLQIRFGLNIEHDPQTQPILALAVSDYELYPRNNPQDITGFFQLNTGCAANTKSPGQPLTWQDHLKAVSDNFSHLAAEASTYQSDALRLTDSNKTEFSFRIFSSSALPDVTYFDQILRADARPSGIDLAAYLGSPWAIAQNPAGLQTALYKKLHTPPDPETYEYRPNTLYEDYLNLLRTLLQPPEPDAPALFANEAWQKKSLQTALGGWAQMRHTFTLQTKLTAHYLGIGPHPIGFVEPNPTFYTQAAQLIASFKTFLTKQDAFELKPKDNARRLRELAGQLEKASSESERIQLGGHLYSTLSQFQEDHPDWREISYGIHKSEGAAKSAATKVRGFADILEKSHHLSLRENPDQLSARWEKLETLAHQLASLCQKQLRQRPFDDADNRILKSYGENLAFIMGYFGSSYFTPRDDAPRWAEIIHYPAEKKSFAVGIGRPRLFNILYPWNGTEILCEGAVTTYYEYDADQRLTDPEWAALLKSPQSPAQPGWLAPLLIAPTQSP